MMRLSTPLALLAGAAALSGCGQSPSQQAQGNAPAIRVRSAEQERLHKLGAFDLAIALKHAIYDNGFICKQVTEAGFIGTYKNLDMWLAKCSEGRQWAVFAGPDGTAQVRDCKDVESSGLPKCVVTEKPAGSFTAPKPGKAVQHANFPG